MGFSWSGSTRVTRTDVPPLEEHLAKKKCHNATPNYLLKFVVWECDSGTQRKRGDVTILGVQPERRHPGDAVALAAQSLEGPFCQSFAHILLLFSLFELQQG